MVLLKPVSSQRNLARLEDHLNKENNIEHNVYRNNRRSDRNYIHEVERKIGVLKGKTIKWYNVRNYMQEVSKLVREFRVINPIMREVNLVHMIFNMLPIALQNNLAKNKLINDKQLAILVGERERMYKPQVRKNRI